QPAAGTAGGGLRGPTVAEHCGRLDRVYFLHGDVDRRRRRPCHRRRRAPRAGAKQYVDPGAGPDADRRGGHGDGLRYRAGAAMSRRSTKPKVRGGFTLVEALVVSGLMALLAYLLGQTWSGLGRPTADLAARGRIAHEARLASAALSRDLGGSLDSAAGRTAQKALGKFVGRMQPNGSALWLCFDGGP